MYSGADKIRSESKEQEQANLERKAIPIEPALGARAVIELSGISESMTEKLGMALPPAVVTLVRSAVVCNLVYKRRVTPLSLVSTLGEFGLEPKLMLQFAMEYNSEFAAEYKALESDNLENTTWATLFLLTATSRVSSGLTLLIDAEVAATRLLNRSGEERPANLTRMLRGLALEPLALPAAKLPEFVDFTTLALHFPNFGPVVQFYAGQVALRKMVAWDSAGFPPVLLVGSPGIGKTRFTTELGKAMGLDHHMIPMNSQTGGFILGGLDSGWSTGKPGRVYACLAESRSRNPLIVLDEIDKTGGSLNQDPLGPLYGLLEPGTAGKFVDEFLNVPVDASGIIWIATANNLSNVPEAIRSRFIVFEVESPDAAQLGAIADRILRELTANDHGVRASLSAEARQKLAKGSVRDLKLAIQQALGPASLRAMASCVTDIELTAVDLAAAAPPERRSIGFMAM